MTPVVRRVVYRRMLTAALAILLLVGIVGIWQLPELGANGLLHPARRPLTSPRPAGCVDETFGSSTLRLRGWRCAASRRRGTVVFLHGIADNRASGIGVIGRFVPRGFDVIVYDSRGHGESDGDTCTYGFFEKDDLRSVLDTVRGGPIVLIGTSLGAAVALQEAADDARVSAVVAAETFSDLRTVAAERAPFVFTAGSIRAAFRLAEERAHFSVDAVDPKAAASRIVCPVFLVHGADDRDTPPDHSRRVFDALRGPKELLIVPSARHNGSLTAPVWTKLEEWIDKMLAS